MLGSRKTVVPTEGGEGEGEGEGEGGCVGRLTTPTLGHIKEQMTIWKKEMRKLPQGWLRAQNEVLN